MADAPKDTHVDPYQAKYMAEGALYYDKFRAPRAYHLIFLLPLLICLASAGLMAAQGGPSALLLGLFWTVVMGLVWLLFSVLRISVTRVLDLVHSGVLRAREQIGGRAEREERHRELREGADRCVL